MARKNCFETFAGMVFIFAFALCGIIEIFNLRESNSITGGFITATRESLLSFNSILVIAIIALLLLIFIVYQKRRKH